MLVTTLGWPEQEGQEASSPTWPPGERRWLSHSSLHLRAGEGHAPCQVTSDEAGARSPRFCLCFTIFLFLFSFSGLEFHTKFSGETNHFRLLGGGVGGDKHPEKYVY